MMKIRNLEKILLLLKQRKVTSAWIGLEIGEAVLQAQSRVNKESYKFYLDRSPVQFEVTQNGKFRG